jgi:outer membrane protein
VTNHQRSWVQIAIVLGLALAPPRAAAAQGEHAAEKPLTLEEAVNLALKNYPAVRAAVEQASAARAGVGLARTSYLPRTDLLWQSNRATRNNIFGLLFPQAVVPSISGPVLATANGDSVWGSAGGLLFSWEPFDFGYRSASVKAARANVAGATAEISLTRLDVAVAAATAFLNLLANQETARAASADVDRRQVFAKTVRVLVDNELRPGADAARGDAELAQARIRQIQAEQAERVSRAVLAQAMGVAGAGVSIEAGPLLATSPQAPLPETPLAAHPLAKVDKARTDEAAARLHVLDRSYFPRFNLQSSLAGRGSGANVDGSVATGLNGLGLERYNWAVGMTVTFPLFDFASLRARKQIEAANERAEAARYDQAIQDLTGQFEQARAVWEGARQIAEQTPVELQAARATESQARARYQAGLGTIVEVADAQRLLVQAEIDDSLARLAVWRALFGVSAAQGDLEAFLQLLRAKTPGGP